MAPATGHCPRCLLEMAMAPRSGTSSGRPQTPAPTVEALQPLFEGYELQTLLGRGGMGFVYRARHRKLDRLVALKVLRPDIAADPAFAERFEREARALAMLNHPGIVAVHDFGRAGDFFFLVMEFVDGANLRDLLRQGQLTTRDVLAFVPQLCDALQFAHDRRVVHRDIKPENILVDQEGRVRIADFGLAKLLGDERSPVGLTQSDQAVGTPHYMAPEQIVASGAVDHRADLYSLGVVLYEMLTGTLPIGRFQPPSARSQTARRFDPVVMKSLENDPAQRYQRAGDVKTDVQAAGGEADRHDAATPTAAAAAKGNQERAQAAPPSPSTGATLRDHPSWMTYNLSVIVGCVVLVATQVFVLAIVVYLGWLAASRLALPPAPGTPRDPLAPRPLPWAHVLGSLAVVLASFMTWATVDSSRSTINPAGSSDLGGNLFSWGHVFTLDAVNGSIFGMPLLVVPCLAVLVAVMVLLRTFGFGVPTPALLAAEITGALLPLVLLIVVALDEASRAGVGASIVALVFLYWLLLELQRHAAATIGGRSRRRRSRATARR